MQKSAQIFESKRDRSKHEHTFECLNVERLTKSRSTVPRREVQTWNRRREKDESCFGGGGVENSRLTIALFNIFVNYFIRTSI